MAPLFLAIALPILMAQNNEKFDQGIILTFVSFALVGIRGCLYFLKYQVTIGPESFTVESLGRRPLTIAWRDVRSVRISTRSMTFLATANRKVAFSSTFPGYFAIEDAAARMLPHVVFDKEGRRAEAEIEITDPEEQKLSTTQ